jgi:epoxyqueuosine reductase
VEKRELTGWIKAKALELGFTKAGIAEVEPFTKESARLQAWLEAGMHGYMSYMERNQGKRSDPREILPSAKSILSLALNYYSPKQHSPNAPKISRYAWGTDYHEIIPPMLERLLADIKTVAPETEGRYYVDTGPLFEKAIAEHAGVGWIGKHTNVITREVGSWVFLSEILLNLELEPDQPAENLCGTCTACIDACPTKAITSEYSLDATRCISYLTIELNPQHEIPESLALNFEDWLYGCDICQDVCPWNRFETTTTIQEFAPRIENTSLTSNTILGMEQPEFSDRFRKSPVKRTKLAGLKRNAKVLLKYHK